MDSWDPNIVLAPNTDPCIILGDDRGTVCALVSPEDYQWAVQWRWSPKWSRGGRKVYLRRNVQVGTRENRIQTNLFLHRAIMIHRMKIEPPTPEHTIVDHVDGDGLNCQRNNLRWFTPSENAKNSRRAKTYYHLMLG